MKPENMPRADFVVSILLMGFGLWLVVAALQMPRFENLGANPFSVPGIDPGYVALYIATTKEYIDTAEEHLVKPGVGLDPAA